MDLSEEGGHLKDLTDLDSKCTKENVTTITESGNGLNPRVARNVMERKRKEKIKMLVSQLKEMLPPDFLPTLKRPMPHNVVLGTVVTYIQHLKEQNEQLLQNKGSEVQGEEIRRLKRELSTVTKERDSYEKMVKSAAACTSAVIPQLDPVRETITTTPLQPPPLAQPFTSTAGNRLPGQGLIITQNGQAYYVNEQGVPIAQGMAPPQLMTDSLMSKSLVTTGNTTSVTTTVSTSESSNSTATTTSSTSVSTGSSPASAAQAKLSVTTPVTGSTSGVCNGLVAVPGHTGQLPSAIILPNGQVIPVVTSNNNVTSTAVSSGAPSTSTMCTTLTSTASSCGVEVTSTTTSLSSSVMLLGQQPAVNNIVLSSNPLHPVIDGSSQLGRRIMPKPQVLAPFPSSMNVVAPVSLTPLPAPTCSVAAAPEFPLASKKKKRTRKKKAIKASEEKSSDDILAAATASLFYPKGSNMGSDVTSVPQKENVTERQLSKTTEQTPASKENHPVTSSALYVPPASPVSPVLDMTSSTKKVQKRKAKNYKTVPEKAGGSSKKLKSHPPTDQGVDVSTPKKPEAADHNTNSQQDIASKDTEAIEFDPNDLDMVLDQVENNISAAQKPKDSENRSRDKENRYQVLDEGADIGHIFSTSTEARQDKRPEGSASPAPMEDKDEVESSRPSYSVSDSYLIGNLTKTAEPVDHRWLGESSVTESKTSAAAEGYSKPKTASISEPKSIATTNVNEIVITTMSISSSDSSQASIDKTVNTNEYFGGYFHQNHIKPDENASIRQTSKVSTPVASKIDREHRQHTGSTQKTSVAFSSPLSNATSSSPTGGVSPYYSPISQSSASTSISRHTENLSNTDTNTASFAKQSNSHPVSLMAGHSEPTWSPARESERSSMNVNYSTLGVGGPMSASFNSNALSQPTVACPEPQWQSQSKTYHYTGFNAHPSDSHNRPASGNSGSKQQPVHSNMPWSINQTNQSTYREYQPQQAQVQQRSSAVPSQQDTGSPSHHTPAFSTARNLRVEQSQRIESSHPIHQERPSNCNQIGASPKSHAFSTESLLNKPTDRRSQSALSVPTDRGFLPPTSMNVQSHYDKSYTSSHSNNVPFNVNLFSSPSQSFSAFKRQGNFSSNAYNTGLEPNSTPFTFSLTKSTDSVVSATYTPNQQTVPGYSKSAPHHSLFPSHPQQAPASPASNFHPGMNRSEQINATTGFGQTSQQQYQDTNNQQPRIDSSEVAKPEKPKKTRSKPVSQSAVSSKGTTNRQPAMPFHHPTNDISNTPDLFNSQKIAAGAINSPFSLPFQSGFPGMQPHPTTSFPSHSTGLGPGPRFNINSIFKDSPIDSFRFHNPAHSNAMYSPSPHFYSNPMGIGNILGGSHAGIDMNRPTHLGGFPSTHPGFHGFPHTLDFPLTDQSNPNGA